MRLADGLIPTFEVGQRVLVTPRPNTEDVCPHCGLVNDVTTGAHEAIIVEPLVDDEIMCNGCHRSLPSSLGYYVVTRCDSGEIGCAPYTWLTPIEAGDANG